MDTQIEYVVLLACLGFIVTYCLIPIAKRLGRTYGFLAYPGGRKIHDDPIPVLGGVAIFAPQILVFFGCLYLAFTGSSLMHPDRAVKLVALFMGTAWVLIVGLIDD